jgi:nucleoside-diphosphate-sugar epimerase
MDPVDARADGQDSGDGADDRALVVEDGGAADFERLVKRDFPGAQVSFVPDLGRQAIVDSWPEECDDSAARRDWGWTPTYTFESAFEKYLMPKIRARYGKA